jgi:hypothetical protein
VWLVRADSWHKEHEVEAAIAMGEKFDYLNAPIALISKVLSHREHEFEASSAIHDWLAANQFDIGDGILGATGWKFDGIGDGCARWVYRGCRAVTLQYHPGKGWCREGDADLPDALKDRSGALRNVIETTVDDAIGEASGEI